jgi:hypothetical protein
MARTYPHASWCRCADPVANRCHFKSCATQQPGSRLIPNPRSNTWRHSGISTTSRKDATVFCSIQPPQSEARVTAGKGKDETVLEWAGQIPSVSETWRFSRIGRLAGPVLPQSSRSRISFPTANATGLASARRGEVAHRDGSSLCAGLVLILPRSRANC